MNDFFISYHEADRGWAEWIAWQLEEAGYSAALGSHDFQYLAHFIVFMERIAKEADRTIVVLSSDYLASGPIADEWAEAFPQDPTGRIGRVVPVRVKDVHLGGLLASVVYVDLVGLGEVEARERLLSSVSRPLAQPASPPEFPAATARAVVHEPLTYPGSVPDDPPELIPRIRAFKADHPDPRRSAFIMMRFGVSRRHDAILKAVRDVLAEHGIDGLRADDNVYDEVLMMNLRTYLHGCGFGVAVFDRIESENHNPNVALEVGYMLALGKRVCLLKDRSIARLPSDVIGSLYTEFDMDDMAGSINDALTRWLRQRRLT